MPNHLLENNQSLIWLENIGLDFLELSYQYKDPFIILRDQEIVFANSSAESLFAHAPNTLAGKTITDITHQDFKYTSYIDYLDERGVDSSAINEPMRFKWLHKRLGNLSFETEIILFSLKKDLYYNYFGAFILDISHLKGHGPITSDALYNLLTNANEITMIIEPDSGHILHANDQALDFYGYTEQELATMTISCINLLKPAAVKVEMERASNESRNHFNFRHRLSNGDIWNVKVISGPFEYNNEKLLFSKIYPVNKVDEINLNTADFGLIFDQSPLPMVIMSNSLQILHVNRKFEKQFGFSNTDLYMNTIDEYIVPSEFSEESWFFLNMVMSGNTIDYDVVRQDRSRNKKSYHMTAYPLSTTNKSVEKFVVIYEEITEDLKQKQLYDLFLKTFDHIREGVIITKPNHQIIWANQAFLKLSEYSLEELKMATPRILKSGEHSHEYYESMWLSINSNGFWSGEIRNTTKSGKTLLEWLTILDVKNNLGQTINYIGVIYDITNYKANEEKILNLAYYDHLTQLYARGYFLEQAEVALETASIAGQRLCLYYLDVDFFKQINDSYGHHVGDQVLIKIALILKSVFDNEEMISRIGGDEFVVLSVCNNTTLKDVHENLKKIEAIFDSPVTLEDGNQLKLTISVGYSIFPKEGANFDDLLHVADQKMYQVKAIRHFT